jgi:hypothetical protein
MRTSTLVLSFTTAFFACSTAYLAWQVQTREDGPASASLRASAPDSLAGGLRAVDSRSSASAESVRSRAITPATQTSVSTPAILPGTTAVDASKDELADMQAAFSRQQLARLADPVQRANLLTDSRASLRRQYARLREKLNLGDSAFEQLVSILAEKELQSQESYLRCATTAGCDTKEYFQKHPVDDRSQELLALLGADKVDELTKYQTSIAERDAVAQLRGRLTDANSIGDEQAERLALALADERERFQKETSARGSEANGFGTNLGMIFYSSDSNSAEQRLMEASQYSQRLRQRAAGVLSPAQLAAYNQMQDELLAQVATFLKPASTAHKQRV